MDEGIYAPDDPTRVAFELWTAAHGVAALLIATPYLPWGEAETLADRVLRAVCCGQIISGLVGYDASPEYTIDRLLDRGGKRSG